MQLPLQLVAGRFIKIQRIMTEKRTNVFKSPDLSKLKEIIIDHRTKIYIAQDADVEEARKSFLSRNSAREKK